MFTHITLLLLLLGLTAYPCLAEVTDEPGAPVKVSVYYETLCPDSHRFITNQLYPVWLNLTDIMEIDINAYGKANDTEVEDGYMFECQHGPDECEGNIMMACAREYIQDDELFMTFLNCIMSEFEGASAGELCALEAGVDFLPIDTCYSSEEGQYLLHEVGVKESQLQPPLNYVPWILINDVFTVDQLIEAQENLQKVVCEAYTGDLPAACSS